MIRKRWTIGLIGTYFGDTVGVAECAAVTRAVGRRGANLVVFGLGSHLGGSSDRATILANVDAVLIRRNSLPSLQQAAQPLLQELCNLPALVIRQKTDFMPSVVHDIDAAFEAALEHLVSRHGRRRVAVLGGVATVDRLRRNPVVDRLALDASLFIAVDEYLTDSWGDVRRVLPRADAIVTEQAKTARGTMWRLQADGFLVPDDVAIVSCECDAGAEYYVPALTTFGASLEVAAARGADHILDCLEKGEHPQDLVVPAFTVERESCGCLILGGTGDECAERLALHTGGAAEKLCGRVTQYALATYEPGLPSDVRKLVNRLVPVCLHDIAASCGDHFRNEVGSTLEELDDQPAMSHAVRRSVWALQGLALSGLAADAVRRERARTVLRNAWKQLAHRGEWLPDYLFPTPRSTIIKCANVEHHATLFADSDKSFRHMRCRMAEMEVDRLAVVLTGNAEVGPPLYRLFGLMDIHVPEPLLPDEAVRTPIAASFDGWFHAVEPFGVFVMSFAMDVDENTRGFVVLETKGGAAIAEACRRGVASGVSSALLYRRNQRQHAEVARVNRDLEAFAYTVSHDLKAPLRGIASVAEWLSTDCAEKLNAEEREMLQLMLARVFRMHRLIDGILRYSRAGRVRGATEDVDLGRLARDVVDSLSLSDTVKVEVSSLPVVKCDQTSMAEVLSNLLSNAVKHNDRPEKRVRISCERDSDGWVLAVADNGPGIAPRHFDKIFRMFETLSVKDENTGVGLSIVRKLVEDWGGRIWVESIEGQGATFRFTLPVQAGSVVATDVGRNET